MRNLLYIGNNLNSVRANVSAIQTLGPLLEQGGYKMYYASSKSNKLVRLCDMIGKCLLLYRKVDYVIIDTYSTLNFYYALIISQLCRILRKPYITILHGGNLPERLTRSAYFSRLIFKNAKRNIAPSKYIQSAFETNGYVNLEYIPNTIEIKKYDFRKRQLKTPKLLWVRSFSKLYNPALAIKVVAELKNMGVDTVLCMVGPDSNDGSFKTTQKLASEQGIEVDFRGKLPKSEWLELSKKYNIFLNTTNFDNMPVSVIEAMAMGLLVISTNVGGMPYLITDKVNGILVEPNMESAIVNEILKVLNNPEDAHLMINKARVFAEQLDWEIVKKEWNRVLI